MDEAAPVWGSVFDAKPTTPQRKENVLPGVRIVTVKMALPDAIQITAPIAHGSQRSLCGIQWSNTLDLLLDRLCRVPKINGSLCVEPKLRAGAEQPGKTQGHRRTHGGEAAG